MLANTPGVGFHSLQTNSSYLIEKLKHQTKGLFADNIKVRIYILRTTRRTYRQYKYML